MEILEPVDITSWEGPFRGEIMAKSADALETGKLLYAPSLAFDLSESERKFLSPDCLNGSAKNVSFRPESGELKGTSCVGADLEALREMVGRYHEKAVGLLNALCPDYSDSLTVGFTSFRPAQIAGRSRSWRQDDTRLHVDAFPSRPMRGLRILRVFSNVNPEVPRVWRIGEHFEDAAAKFLPGIEPQNHLAPSLMEFVGITKGQRSRYDHYMLGIHDRMKADDSYQEQVPQTELAIPAGATWACYTDSVSHAAMSGQFAFEQTFYLPVSAMKDPQRSPLRILERLVGRSLV